MLDSDKEEDDSGILSIFGLGRDEFTGFIVVVVAILLALLYFRGCSTTTDLNQTILPQPADGLAEAEIEGRTEVTDLRIGYRPDYVHFDGTGEKSQPVELFVNGASIGETETTFRGEWAYEIRDLEPGIYEVYSEHPNISRSQSAARVFVIAENNDGTDQTVTLYPDGATVADATADKVASSLNTNSITKPVFDSALTGAVLTAGAITLNGTGSPNLQHLLLVNGEEVASTTSDANGDWSFNYNQETAGDYDVSVVAISSNEPAVQVASDRLTLGLAAAAVAQVEQVPTLAATAVVEEVALVEAEPIATEMPATAEPEPTVVPEFTISILEAVAGATSDEMVVINGRAEPGMLVGVYVDNTLVSATPAGSDGSWTFSGLLSPGMHQVEARLFDGALSDSPIATAMADVDITAARDIKLINSGRDGLFRLVFADGSSDGNGGTGTDASGNLAADGALAGAPAVELIVDASWSMTFPLDSDLEVNRLTADDPNSRIGVARAAMIDLVENKLAEGAPVALRAFGNIEGNFSCRTDLMSELQPLNRENLVSTINSIAPQINANTALAASLAQVNTDMGDTDRKKIVVLLTDGKETCGGDPGVVIQSLADAGTDVQVNIIGFAIQDPLLKAEFETWARLGNGRYFDAADAAQLGEALTETSAVRYTITDLAGNTVKSGSVSGQAIDLEPGIYNIVNQNGDVIYTNLVITPGSINELVER